MLGSGVVKALQCVASTQTFGTAVSGSPTSGTQGPLTEGAVVDFFEYVTDNVVMDAITRVPPMGFKMGGTNLDTSPFTQLDQSTGSEVTVASNSVTAEVNSITVFFHEAGLLRPVGLQVGADTYGTTDSGFSTALTLAGPLVGWSSRYVTEYEEFEFQYDSCWCSRTILQPLASQATFSVLLGIDQPFS